MIRSVHNKRVLQRVLYTLCFFAFCIIDWVKVSLNGRAQMTAANVTGVVLAVIVISSFNVKRIINWSAGIWLVVCAVAVPLGIRMTLSVYPYRGQVITATLNIVLYGFALIQIVDLIKQKKNKGVRISFFLEFLIMLLLMFFSINENIWPIWYAVAFGTFYLTEFDKDIENTILQSIPDGIILGFFVIQGMALLFRPYDIVRYTGLYINPNFNALFYLMSYSAYLCKWYQLKKDDKSPTLRVVFSVLAASMYGFCIYTGSKTAILAMFAATIPFSLMVSLKCKNKLLSFIGCWLKLGLVGIISIPIVYGAIRYMPTIHLHPLYFEGEYSIYKVQPGEPRDSEKYITFENAMESNAGRVFYNIPMLKEYMDSFLTLKVYAAELEDIQDTEYLFSEEEVAEGIDPVELRHRIHKYYFERLNLTGHTNDYEWAQIDIYDTAPHAHNVFIQMAFLYGIPAGIMFIGMVVAFIPGVISLMKVGEELSVCLIACFVTAFIVFGFFEIDWMCGQLPFTLFFVLFREVVRKQ